jgi:hypothetical protein
MAADKLRPDDLPLRALDAGYVRVQQMLGRRSTGE